MHGNELSCLRFDRHRLHGLRWLSRASAVLCCAISVLTCGQSASGMQSGMASPHVLKLGHMLRAENVLVIYRAEHIDRRSTGDQLLHLVVAQGYGRTEIVVDRSLGGNDGIRNLDSSGQLQGTPQRVISEFNAVIHSNVIRRRLPAVLKLKGVPDDIALLGGVSDDEINIGSQLPFRRIAQNDELPGRGNYRAECEKGQDCREHRRWVASPASPPIFLSFGLAVGAFLIGFPLQVWGWGNALRGCALGWGFGCAGTGLIGAGILNLLFDSFLLRAIVEWL